MSAAVVSEQSVHELSSEASSTFQKKRDEFDSLTVSQELSEKDKDSIDSDWDNLGNAFVDSLVIQDPYKKSELLKYISYLIIEFKERYASLFNDEQKTWLCSFADGLKVASKLFYGLGLLGGTVPEDTSELSIFVPYYSQDKLGPQEFVILLMLNGISLISDTVVDYLNWLDSGGITVNSLSQICKSIIFHDWVSDLNFESKHERENILQHAKYMRMTSKSILWDLDEFIKDQCSKEQKYKNQAALKLIGNWKSEKLSDADKNERKEDFEYLAEIVDSNRIPGQGVFSS